MEERQWSQNIAKEVHNPYLTIEYQTCDMIAKPRKMEILRIFENSMRKDDRNQKK